MTTGEKLKEILSRKALKVSDLAREANIPINDLRNLIYNKTKKRSLILKISEFLGINPEYLLDSPTLNEKELLSKEYFEALEIVKEVVKNYNIPLTKGQLDKFISLLYLYCSRNNVSKEIKRGFVEGLIYITYNI
ncbi:MAG: helix-turn-helix transcriptional regulator [Sphingobacteriia bacterium]|nr:helix-turn-helix transcriptional regulator [Sphingobacteriia bacterium]